MIYARFSRVRGAFGSFGRRVGEHQREREKEREREGGGTSERPRVRISSCSVKERSTILASNETKARPMAIAIDAGLP